MIPQAYGNLVLVDFTPFFTRTRLKKLGFGFHVWGSKLKVVLAFCYFEVSSIVRILTLGLCLECVKLYQMLELCHDFSTLWLL